MSFKDTSGNAVIDAVLTDIGRKRMANGTFRPVKFALGDDEIDYSLIGPDAASTSGIDVPISSSAMFEAYGSETKNIQYALNTYETLDSLYFPILKLNDKVSITAQMSGSIKRAQALQAKAGDAASGLTGGTSDSAPAFYLAVNDETADKMRDILTGDKNFKFLEDRRYEGFKIVIESGLDNIPIEDTMSDRTDTWGLVEADSEGAPYSTIYYNLPVAIDYSNRIKYLVKRNLLDRYYMVMADYRFIEKVIGPSRGCSVFMNFADGAADINFQTTQDSVAINYANQFEDYQTFLIDGVPNLMFDHEMFTYPSTKYSNLFGPKGTATALNFAVWPKMKVNSTGTRDYRYSKYGTLDQPLFGTADKFDYIETIVNVIGATTDSKIQIPVRIIRYSGT